MILTLKPQTLNVLLGPQGCGKTTTARASAHAVGTFVELSTSILDSPFELGAALSNEPRVAIFDNDGLNNRQWQVLSFMADNEFFRIDRKMREPRTIMSPIVVLCSVDAEFLRLPSAGSINLVEISENIQRPPHFGPINLGPFDFKKGIQ